MLDDVVDQLLHSPDPTQTVGAPQTGLGPLTLSQVGDKLRGTVGGEAAAGRHALEQVPQLLWLQHQSVGFRGLVICGVRIVNNNFSAELVLIFLGDIKRFHLNFLSVERNQGRRQFLSLLQVVD